MKCHKLIPIKSDDLSQKYVSKTISSRTPFIGGNWKCNGTCETVTILIDMLNDITTNNAEIVIAPPMLHIQHVVDTVNMNIDVAVQNVSHQVGYGAFTGEITADMARDVGARWAIIGHSERRHKIAAETYTEVATRAICAHDAGLKVILCIGETEQEHAMGKTKEVCIAQLIALDFATRQSLLLDTVIAYEPVWAIGTGQSATPEQAEEVHSTIRSWIRETVGDHLADTTRIIYGGSVKSDNCKVLIACDNIDGFLIGGASLTEEFATIINKIK